MHNERGLQWRGFLLAGGILMSCIGGASAADLRVLAGGAMVGIWDELKPLFESATGHKIELFFGTTPNLIKETNTGVAFDVGLVPTEVMVKQPKGFNELTHDWEFFDLDVSKNGTKIRTRGFAETVNRFGGNCFGCHIKAQPQWDFICETGHGCDPIPLTESMIKAIQRTDPRCPGSDNVSAEDAAALKQLQEVLKPKTPAANSAKN